MARILIAEDEHSVREFVRRALEMSGHQVMLACDGSEAAATLAASDDIDLLLTDIKMPVMDGIALALKAARDRPSMPILLMTAYADQRERAHGLSALISDVINKPFTLDQLTELVDRTLA